MVQTRNMMASLVLAVVLMATSTFPAANAEEYVVGNITGWVVPCGHVNHYKNWASDYKFKVGDTLIFNFVTGMHDVAEVTKEAYECCDCSNPLATVIKDGPAKIRLETARDHYYICTIPHHCKLGTRLAVHVSCASAHSSPIAASPETAPSAAPVHISAVIREGEMVVSPASLAPVALAPAEAPASSAASSLAASLFVVSLSVAISFFL